MSKDIQLNNLFVSGVTTIPSISLSRTDKPVPLEGSIAYNLDDTSVYVSKGTPIGWIPIGGGIINTQVIITDTTPSTSCSTGALIVDGGVGIAGNLNVCGNTTIAGTTIISSDEQSTSCITGALVVPTGGVGIGGNLNVCGNGTFEGYVTINSDVQSTSCTTGAVVIAGGVGVGGNVSICGYTSLLALNITDTEPATNCQTGALTVAGGTGIAGDLYVCGTGNFAEQLRADSNAASSSSTTGSLITMGGVGIAGNLYVGEILNVTGSSTFVGYVDVTNATPSTSCLTGAVRVAGGVGIQGALNVCTTISVPNLSVTGTTLSSNCTTGALTVVGGTGIQGSLNVCGNSTIKNLAVTGTTASTNCTTGALVVTGGVGIQGALNLCGTIGFAPNTTLGLCSNPLAAVTVEGTQPTDGVFIVKDCNNYVQLQTATVGGKKYIATFPNQSTNGTVLLDNSVAKVSNKNMDQTNTYNLLNVLNTANSSQSSLFSSAAYQRQDAIQIPPLTSSYEGSMVIQMASSATLGAASPMIITNPPTSYGGLLMNTSNNTAIWTNGPSSGVTYPTMTLQQQAGGNQVSIHVAEWNQNNIINNAVNNQTRMYWMCVNTLCLVWYNISGTMTPNVPESKADEILGLVVDIEACFVYAAIIVAAAVVGGGDSTTASALFGLFPTVLSDLNSYLPTPQGNVLMVCQWYLDNPQPNPDVTKSLPHIFVNNSLPQATLILTSGTYFGNAAGAFFISATQVTYGFIVNPDNSCFFVVGFDYSNFVGNVPQPMTFKGSFLYTTTPDEIQID